MRRTQKWLPLGPARCYCTQSATSRRSKGHWFDVNNQRAYFDECAERLKITEWTGWYGCSTKQFIRAGGAGLLAHYQSLESALRAVYPHLPWESSRFIEERKAPNGYWHKKGNVMDAITRAEAKLGIKQPEDWHAVALTDLREIGFPSIITKPRLAELLSEKYPEHKWENMYLLQGRYGQQKRLERLVAVLFQGQDIRVNVRKDGGLINPNTGEYLELDIYLPSLSLAFEYQEKHHFVASDHVYQPLANVIERDRVKKELLSQKGITLITVPCWWDGLRDSLVASIKRQRLEPDLLQDAPVGGIPIPDEAPAGFFDKQVATIEGIGQPTTACFFTLTDIDPTNWWLFEKYDGVRAFWNPEKKEFYSRKGKLLSMPQHLIAAMPEDIFLDGEFWFGRGNFQETMKMVNKLDQTTVDWSKFTYMVFDAPKHNGPYAERQAALANYFAEKPCSFVKVAQPELCKDFAHLERFFQDVIDQGGEGVILRDPKALLEPGRSQGYLKHKKFRDAEAKIVQAVGTHQWECELPNGVKFIAPAGTGEFAKRWKPLPGDIVSFKHRGFLLASKKPKLPTLYRVRKDVAWEDVCANWKEQKTTYSAYPLRRDRKHKIKGYWHDKERCRNYFLSFAEEMGFDPSKADNWYNTSTAQIIAKKGVGPLAIFNGSFKRALMWAFPEWNFSFKERRPKNYWKDVNNCRNFFDLYAKEKGFDPLITTNWMKVRLEELRFQMGSGVSSTREVLKSAYPELQFPPSWNKATATL